MAETPLNFTHRGLSLRGRLILFALLSLALLFLDSRFHAVDSIRSAAAETLYPVQWLVRQPVDLAGSASAYFSDKQTLRSDNRTLREDNARLRSDKQRLAVQLHDLQRLEALVSIRSSALPQALAAEIVSTRNNAAAAYFTINKGSRSGVRPGDPIADEKGLVGQVASVQPFSSQVMLMTNGRFTVPVMVARTGVRTLIYGSADNPDLPFFPADASLQPGDLLITSGMDSTYPAGIPVATVVTAQSGNGSPYYRTLLKAAADIDSTRFVLVIPQKTPAALPNPVAASEVRP